MAMTSGVSRVTGGSLTVLAPSMGLKSTAFHILESDGLGHSRCSRGTGKASQADPRETFDAPSGARRYLQRLSTSPPRMQSPRGSRQLPQIASQVSVAFGNGHARRIPDLIP